MRPIGDVARAKAIKVGNKDGYCLCECSEYQLAQIMNPAFDYTNEQRELLRSFILDPDMSKPSVQLKTSRAVNLAAAWWRLRATGR